ncbi:hypothetical protein Cgig2_018377 [Carnegiea gigantea]|uniref:Uncharacterized protein n=1 Tax=Carnegiea gigantea TaxID=171969 RepID=A0A9Q1JUT5_9CARY|nr:hypothetical protein Cgig2_018377 [Carnegiea gigantea]
MKITPTADLTAMLSSRLKNPQKSPDLPKKVLKPTSRRITARTPRKAGPPTPLLRWKFDERRGSGNGVDNNAEEEQPPESRRKSRREKSMSTRKLGAALWRMQVAEGGNDEAEQRRWRSRRKSSDRLGFKFETQDLNLCKFVLQPEAGHGGDRLSCHHASRQCGSEAKDPLRSPCSVNGPINGYLCERQSPFRLSNYAMEGATKWDPVCATNENSGDSKLVDQKRNAASVISALEAELEQVRAHVEELESERRSSKKKLEQFLKKLSEERAAWRAREHEKVRAIIDDVKADLSRERKNRQRLEIVNSKLLNELAEAKLSAKRYLQDYEKERKARELIEEVCDELAKEIGEDKAEVDSLKKECMKIREEVEDERKMLQMAEVWREERVQMKLIDAKVALDKKYSQMSWLVAELEKFLRSNGANLNVSEMREAEMLQRAAALVNIDDIKEFTYEPSNSDDIFAVVEEMAMAESNEREIEQCVECSPASHRINNHSKDGSNVYVNQSGDVDDDGSGWETVSHAEDQGSSYSPEGSITSGNKMARGSNVSGSCTEWEEQGCEETPITEISEVCSIPSKKAKPISRLWRSRLSNVDNYKTITVDGMNGGLSNGRVSKSSNDHGSREGGVSPLDMAGWSSPDSGNPHINRGMKGCIEWHRGSQKNSPVFKRLQIVVVARSSGNGKNRMSPSFMR